MLQSLQCKHIQSRGDSIQYMNTATQSVDEFIMGYELGRASL